MSANNPKNSVDDRPPRGNIRPVRFEGIERLLGPERAGRLARARVMVVGLGGVGSWAAEALARCGVGALVLVDGDDVCASNINRQLHAVTETVGRPKADVMAERVRAIHPSCEVIARHEFFRAFRQDAFFDRPLDAVIDCIDGVSAKAALIAAARGRQIPVISCGGAAGKLDPALVQSADLADVHHDRLLMFVRKKLRRLYAFPCAGKGPMGVPCVFSPEPPLAGPCTTNSDLLGEGGPACDRRLGSAVFVTAVFGFHAAALAVRFLARTDDLQSHGRTSAAAVVRR